METAKKPVPPSWIVNIRKARLKGVLGGRKLPLTAQMVADIKHILKHMSKTRDLALFSVAVDSMLRSCDLIRLRYEELVNPETGEVLSQCTVRQAKTDHAVTFVLSDRTREAVADWVAEAGKKLGDPMWTGFMRYKHRPLRKGWYRILLKRWLRWIGIKNVDAYSTHSTRRTKPTVIYEGTKDIEVCRQLLGHKSLAHTAAYLGVGNEKALEVARKFDL